MDSRTAPKPAEADAAKFQLHPSVNAWRTYDPAATVDADAPLATQIQSLLQVPAAPKHQKPHASQISFRAWMAEFGVWMFSPVPDGTLLL